MQISHLFAAKPQAFGPKGSPSSIIKKPYTQLCIQREGAIEDEQGNKKLHGGPFMALHQYAQSSYTRLANTFKHSAIEFSIGSIGENLSAPNMNDNNVFIGDQYQVGTCLIQVVSPRAPCSKINHRFQNINPDSNDNRPDKIDQFIAKHSITGWYYSVLEEGTIHIGDNVERVHREGQAISVAQIWQLRELNKVDLNSLQKEQLKHYLALADSASNTAALAPEWQAHMNRVAVKLAKVS